MIQTLTAYIIALILLSLHWLGWCIGNDCRNGALLMVTLGTLWYLYINLKKK